MLTAYTIGRTSQYDAALSSLPWVLKLGKHGPSPESPEGYEGGAVWQAGTDAEVYLTVSGLEGEYSVYEVRLPGAWIESTHGPLPGEPFHRLLRDGYLGRKFSSVYPGV